MTPAKNFHAAGRDFFCSKIMLYWSRVIKDAARGTWWGPTRWHFEIRTLNQSPSSHHLDDCTSRLIAFGLGSIWLVLISEMLTCEKRSPLSQQQSFRTEFIVCLHRPLPRLNNKYKIDNKATKWFHLIILKIIVPQFTIAAPQGLKFFMLIVGGFWFG